MNLSYEKLASVAKAKGYRWYVGDMNLNVFGVRTANRRANSFDDILGVAYEFEGSRVLLSWPATTDPGLDWLKRPMNIDGCAILVPGQYPVYKIRLHRGSYEALCQTFGPVKVYRDNNRDAILDFDPATISSGDYGINLHHASNAPITDEVNKYSAGCQVFKRLADFNFFMALCRKSRRIYGDHFTYTLYTEQDVAL